MRDATSQTRPQESDDKAAWWFYDCGLFRQFDGVLHPRSSWSELVHNHNDASIDYHLPLYEYVVIGYELWATDIASPSPDCCVARRSETAETSPAPRPR
jgi:hypothetical protein